VFLAAGGLAVVVAVIARPTFTAWAGLKAKEALPAASVVSQNYPIGVPNFFLEGYLLRTYSPKCLDRGFLGSPMQDLA
jgi:hypothetical protein